MDPISILTSFPRVGKMELIVKSPSLHHHSILPHIMRLFLLISRLLPLLKAQKMHNSSTLKSYIIYTLTSDTLQSYL